VVVVEVVVVVVVAEAAEVVGGEEEEARWRRTGSTARRLNGAPQLPRLRFGKRVGRKR
jgi:hypothetical protein